MQKSREEQEKCSAVTIMGLFLIFYALEKPLAVA